MTCSYEGDVELAGSDYVSSQFRASIGDLDDDGWLGQLVLDEQVPEATFGPGDLTVVLLSGERNGWCAPAYVDAAGALRGHRAFAPPTLPH